MSLEKKRHKLIANTRIEARKEIVMLFLEENCGTGKVDLSSKYEYMVEKYKNYTILLKRPAPLNKGFDFIVHIDGMYFKSSRRHTNPSHSDIIQILKKMKNEIPQTEYKKIMIEINNIYKLKEFNIDNVSDYNFLDYENTPRPIVIILLAIKWLFMEQDITYWNWSGRAMLMNGLQENNLV